MWRSIIQLLGIALSAATSIGVFFAFVSAFVFRPDTSGEILAALKVDVLVGTVFALTVTMVWVPPREIDSRRYRRAWLAATVVAWVVVVGGLCAARHFLGHGVRASLAAE